MEFSEDKERTSPVVEFEAAQRNKRQGYKTYGRSHVWALTIINTPKRLDRSAVKHKIALTFISSPNWIFEEFAA